MPPTAHSKASNDRDGSPYGPSWYDVYILLADLHARFPHRDLSVTLHLNTSVNKKAGLCVWVTDGGGTVWGAQRYLDKGPESSATAAAAFWTALTKAFNRLERVEEDEGVVSENAKLQLDIIREADPPEGMGE